MGEKIEYAYSVVALLAESDIDDFGPITSKLYEAAAGYLIEQFEGAEFGDEIDDDEFDDI